MKLSKAASQFVADLRLSKAPQAVTAYESDLHRLVALAVPDSVLAFTHDLARLYFQTASAQGLKMSTLHRKRAVLNEFGKWGVRNRLWNENPLATMEPIRRPETLPRPFTEDQVTRLTTLELPAHENVLRWLLLYTGLRVTPICNIKVGDVSFEPPCVRTIGKGNKPHSVPLHPVLKETIFNYVVSHTDLKGHSPLLSQRNGRPFSRKLVERITRRWGVLANVPECVPHRFRHTVATELLRAGADIRVIQRLLNHADLESTAIYTKVHDVQVNSAIGKLRWGDK